MASEIGVGGPRDLAPPASVWSRWLPVALVVAATALAWLPTLRNGFVDFDDQTNLTENPFFRGLGPAALRWMFTNLEGHYIPLTWLSFALDHQVWGMNPVGYHLTNLLLHLANAVVFYWLCVRLLRLAFRLPADAAPPSLFVGAGFAAALFALHPLRVESVAWATERRDVLSGLFVLLTLDAYLRFHTRRDGFASGALGWYVLSLLAKPVGMSLAIVLVVLDLYPLRRLPGRVGAWLRPEARPVWLEKVPYLALGIATAVVEGIAERSVGAFYSLAQHGVPGRVGEAFFGLAFYLEKTVVPVGLSPLYQLPVGWRFLRGDVLVSAAFVIAATVAFVAWRRRWPWALAAWACYGALLAPVLGIAQAGPHIAADRYSYLATLAWAAVVGGGVLACDLGARAARRPPVAFRATVAVGALAAVLLGVLTWRQIAVWHDSVTLWRAAVAADPACYVCLNNLGNALVRAGRGDEAPPYLEAALRAEPNMAEARTNLGLALMERGDAAAAEREMRRAVVLQPDLAIAHNNLGALLLRQDRADAAAAEFRRASQLDPSFAEPRYNLGLALAGAHREEAIAALREAIRLRPDYAKARQELIELLVASGRDQEARAQAEIAEQAAPGTNALAALALSYMQAGRSREAIAVLREIIAGNPGDADAASMLAWLLATARDDGVRDGAAAVALAERAVAAAPDADRLDTLAAAYAEAGRFADAVATARRAAAAGQSAGMSDLAREIAERLALYEQGRPFRAE